MRKKYWILYTLYGILITLLFAYLYFPANRLAQYLEAAVTAENPNMIIDFSEFELNMFPSWTCDRVMIKFRDKPDSIIEFKNVTVRPLLMDIVRGKAGVSISGDAYSGTFFSQIRFKELFSISGSCTVSGNMEGIQIGKCSYILALAGREMNGFVDARFSYLTDTDKFLNGEGDARFLLRNGSVPLKNNIFGLEKVAFEQLDALMTVRKRILKINKADFIGQQINGSFAGDLFLDYNILKSRLSLKGSTEIPALNRKVSVVLSGTISNPVVRFR